ncbi:pseudouridine synthase [Desulfovibrio litoralis]|uniref:Pseudouridine synthase n=1 Tax=Desulfovibrio litoralis DSM 11393 TaxID=1121455 RepID=A0A1M7RRY8_9BACT|nr:pseudouridine synthase [Desulfovibrio litoralis]SHN48930.1 23S rRNA pseudouridine2605 synthase [Desulfovibrio litoralis DSM 11393]
MRINKALAQAGICSRRKADELISQGQVRINGETAQTGQDVDLSQDTILINGRKIELNQNAQAENFCYLLLNKPIEIVSTAKDPEGRKTVLDLVPDTFLKLPNNQKRRIYPVGRLDYFSEGLILLSDDGELTHRLTHPSFNLQREYIVAVRGKLTPEMQNIMQKGMTLSEGDKLAPMQVEILSPQTNNYRHLFGYLHNNENTIIKMTLIQGLNRQIRRVCRDLGLTILKLCRISHGPIQLAALPTGKVRSLSEQEIKALYASVRLDK